MFYKKATKIDEIFTVNLTLCSIRQIDREDFVNFHGLLRNFMNFNLEQLQNVVCQTSLNMLRPLKCRVNSRTMGSIQMLVWYFRSAYILDENAFRMLNTHQSHHSSHYLQLKYLVAKMGGHGSQWFYI